MKAMLFSQMAPPEGWENEFEAWYDGEHIPLRMKTPGFHAAIRYHAIDGEPWHLAIYHLDDLSALDGADYQKLKRQPSDLSRRMLDSARGFTRYTCELTFDSGEIDESPGCLFVTAFSVPASSVAQLDSWYDEEHVPMLLEADGWLRVRRYTVQPPSDGPPWTHLTLHELRDAAVLKAPERERARTTTRREALARTPWFTASGRWTYRPVAHHAAIG